MTSIIGGLQLVVLAFLLFALVASSTCAALERIVVSRSQRLASAVRVRALFAFAAAPMLLAVACTAACFAPSLLSRFVPHLDHCLHHGGHPHLCLSHLPRSTGALLGWVTIACAGLFFAGKTVRGAQALLRARALLGRLAALAVRSPSTGTYVIEEATPFCLSAGLFRPAVIISTGLQQGLTPLELQAVLAHEHAHTRRRDALLLAVARALGAFHLPRVARRLMEQLELACELSCDEAAAAHVGDRIAVADTIVAVERLVQGRSHPVAVGFANFGQSCLETRIKALLDEPRRGLLVPGAFTILGGLMLLALVCADPLHHATETLLAAFSH